MLFCLVLLKSILASFTVKTLSCAPHFATSAPEDLKQLSRLSPNQLNDVLLKLERELRELKEKGEIKLSEINTQQLQF